MVNHTVTPIIYPIHNYFNAIQQNKVTTSCYNKATPHRQMPYTNEIIMNFLVISMVRPILTFLATTKGSTSYDMKPVDYISILFF